MFIQHFLIHLAVPPLPVTLWGKVCETPDVVNIAIRVLRSDLEGPYACLGVENKVEVHTPFAFFAHCSGYSGTITSVSTLLWTDIKELAIMFRIWAIVSRTLTGFKRGYLPEKHLIIVVKIPTTGVVVEVAITKLWVRRR